MGYQLTRYRGLLQGALLSLLAQPLFDEHALSFTVVTLRQTEPHLMLTKRIKLTPKLVIAELHLAKAPGPTTRV